MIVEVSRHYTFAPPEPSGADFCSDLKKNPIRTDDQVAFFAMASVMDGYAARVLSGEATVPSSMHSTWGLDYALARTEHQRKYANSLRHGPCVEDEDRLYELSGQGAFERPVQSYLLHVSWGAVSPPSISTSQIAVLRQAIADRAPYATSKAEITGLQYVSRMFGFDQAFRRPQKERQEFAQAARLMLHKVIGRAMPSAVPTSKLCQERPFVRSVRNRSVKTALAAMALSTAGVFHKMTSVK